MYRSNRTSSLGAIPSPGGYRIVYPPAVPGPGEISLSDAVEAYNSAPRPPAGTKVAYSTNQPWAVGLGFTNPEFSYKSVIGTARLSPLPDRMPEDGLIGSGIWQEKFSYITVGDPGYELNQYGVIGTPDDFGIQTGGVIAPVVTSTAPKQPPVFQPAPTTEDDGDKDVSNTSPAPSVVYYNSEGLPYTNEDYSFWQDGSGAWWRGDKAGNIVRVQTPSWAQGSGLAGLPIMPLAGAAAGYFIGGKSIIGALVGFAAGSMLNK